MESKKIKKQNSQKQNRLVIVRGIGWMMEEMSQSDQKVKASILQMTLEQCRS